MEDFFNELIAGYGNPKRAFMNYKKDKFKEHRRREERQELLSSQKFYVNDSLLENAVIASFSQPKALLGMLRKAKPPFNNMWIEWNEKKRIELIHKYCTSIGMKMEDIDPSEQAEKVGYHIRNIDHRNHFLSNDNGKVIKRSYISDVEKTYPLGCFQYQAYMLFGEKASSLKNKIVFPPQSAIINNEEHITFHGNSVSEQVYTMGHAFGNTYRTIHKDNNIFSDICKHSSLVTHDLLLFGYPESALYEMVKGNKQQASEWVNITLSSIEGDIRFIIAVLSLLNYQHNVYQRGVGSEIPKRYKFGGAVPRNEVRVLEIDLPKPFGVKNYEKIFKGFGSPKRQHTRRGHWHTYHYKNGEKVQKWIEEQTVGNPELGKIEHDYILRRRNG